ncbi:MAG: very short patch repair endonuclease [Prolixibacteraceae bacterium]|nr:very short patch repair endonuclease [Prolixibacteraceae bacterium]
MKKYQEPAIKVPRFSEANGFYTTKKRSEIMSKIKASETKPEIRLRKTLWALGFRYRKNVKALPGKPDIVISKFKLAIFIDGNFWHGYNWKEKRGKIKSNRDFWIPKIERNIQRDKENNQKLQQMGFHVFRFWDHQVKKEMSACITRIFEYINDDQEYS